LVPNSAELTAAQPYEIVLNTVLQSQIYVDRSACKVVYTGSIPVVAFNCERTPRTDRWRPP
jgi:hypothetical protein